MKRQLITFIILFLLGLHLFSQDNSIIILKDGREYKGSLLSIGENEIIFQTDGQNLTFDRKNVVKINFHKNRLYENVSDVKEIKDKDIQEIWLNSLKWSNTNNNYAVLLDKTTYDFQDEKNVVIKIKKAIKILSLDGKEESIQFFYYLKNLFKAKLLYAFSVTTDGKIFPVSEDAINDEPVNGDFPLYDKLNRLKFGFKNSDIGTVIIWEAEISGIYDEINYPFFLEKELLNEFPVQKRIIEVTVPKRMDINPAFYHGMINYKEPSLKATEKNGKKILTIEENNIKEFINDDLNCPDNSLLLPSLYINLNKDIKNIVFDYSDRYFNTNITPEISNLAQTITKEAKSDHDKLKKLYEYVNTKIKLVSIHLNETGYSPNNEIDIVNSQYLTVLDKTYLFVRLANSLNIKPQMFFYRSNDKSPVLTKIPSLRQFDNVISIAKIEDKDTFISFENENFSFGQSYFDVSNAYGVDVTTKYAQICGLREISNSDNSTETKYTCEIKDDDTISIEKTTNIMGFDQTTWREKRFISNAELERWEKKRISNLGNNLTLLEYKFINELSNFEKNVIFYEKFIVNDYVISSGDMVKLFKIPEFNFNASAVGKSTRLFPYDLGNTLKNSNQYNISIPQNFKVKYIPKNFNFNNDFVSFSYQTDIKNNIITININTEYKKRIAPKEQYNSLKYIFEEMARLSNEWIILEKQTN